MDVRSTDGLPCLTDPALAVARLALGVCDVHSLGATSGELWEEIFTLAARERCAALIWMRCGTGLRNFLPPQLAAKWRAHAIAMHERGLSGARVLHEVCDILQGAGITPIVLKGLPLALHLYGDIGVRPTADTDLFVPLDQRARCDKALRAAGWRHIEGTPPGESSYQRSSDSSWQSLEVHSALLDENMLAHVDLSPLESSAVEVNGYVVAAHSGLSVPVFLAAHLAKHAEVPLLWWVDFATCWGATPDSDRAAIRAVARRKRCDRYLAWAESGASFLEVIAGTDPARAADALQRLRTLHAARPVVRLARLAGTRTDRLRVCLAWIWPVPLRHRPLAFLSDLAFRARKVLSPGQRHTGLAALPSVGGADRNLEVTRSDFVGLVGATVRAGGSVWIRAKGGSMLPAIPRGAAVRLTPLPAGAVRAGDVVLATLPSGQPVLHRVHLATATHIHLKGDNVARPDIPTPVDNLVAMVDVVRIGDADVPIGERPRRSLRLMLGRLRGRVQGRLQHD